MIVIVGVAHKAWKRGGQWLVKDFTSYHHEKCFPLQRHREMHSKASTMHVSTIGGSTINGRIVATVVASWGDKHSRHSASTDHVDTVGETQIGKHSADTSAAIRWWCTNHGQNSSRWDSAKRRFVLKLRHHGNGGRSYAPSRPKSNQP